MIRVVNVLKDYQKDKHIFYFPVCDESKMYKQFLQKWSDNFAEEEPEEIVEEVKIEKSRVTFLPIDDITKFEQKSKSPHRKNKTYAEYEKDFQRLKLKVKNLENSLTSSTLLRRKKSFKEKPRETVTKSATDLKKLQTFKYLVLSTITSNTLLHE